MSCAPCCTPRHTLPFICMAVCSSHGGRRWSDGAGPRIQRLPLSLPHHIHISCYPCTLSSSPLDDTTLHLIAHSPAHSTLFPGPIRPSDEGTGNTQGTRGPALLEPSRQHTVLRNGLAVVCDEAILPSNPFKISASSLIGLLGLITGVGAGRVALREVYR